MRYYKQIDETLLDEVNLSGAVLTKEEQIRKKIEDFNNSSDVWSDLGNITYRELLFHYEPIAFRDVQYQIQKVYSSNIFLPSKGQRGKTSLIRSNKNEKDYVWNEYKKLIKNNIENGR
jgi:hypothetical protein